MYIWLTSCPFDIHTAEDRIQYERKRRVRVRFFSFFFLVADLEDKVLVKLESPCFGVARLI